MADATKKHDTLAEMVDELPSHKDDTGQLETHEARGFPRGADGTDGYNSDLTPKGDPEKPPPTAKQPPPASAPTRQRR
jgi:hypothetical protein